MTVHLGLLVAISEDTHADTGRGLRRLGGVTDPDIAAAWADIHAALDALPGWFVGRRPAVEPRRAVPVVDVRLPSLPS